MSHGATLVSQLPDRELNTGVERLSRSIDRFAYAHDASHFLMSPEEVLVPQNADDVAEILRLARSAGKPVTFRSGGTSLSGQGVTNEIMVDTRKNFRAIRVEDDGARVIAGVGATVRQVNTRLARFRTKLGPDPASEIACTIGGVIANNSSGMACGTEFNSYQTVESLALVLASGTQIDTGEPHAADKLRDEEPEIYAGLLRLRDQLRSDPRLVERVRHLFSMKNTMGYGINSLLDFGDPVRILEHLVIGSEGTLAFVAEARFRTVPVLPAVSTGLLVFESLSDATQALSTIVALGLATIELLDAESLRVAQSLANAPESITQICVDEHAAFLVEVHASDSVELERKALAAQQVFEQLPLVIAPALTRVAAERASLWEVRKGLYTAIAGGRPPGTTALLEDVVVPVDRLYSTCEGLKRLFAKHGYENAVIFGHAKDGNVHFMLTENFEANKGVLRHQRFIEDMVELVLEEGGSLKAEHGTGRAMASFVRRQYGDELTDMMWELKRLLDPHNILNPGVVLTREEDSYLKHLKVSPRVESEVDRCVECGYCEPTCPSKNLTLTPRQRIVLRREIAAADERGDAALANELRNSYDYDGIQTCAVDGMCGMACPVKIDTGDLVRRLRAEDAGRAEGAAWKAAAKHWGAVTRAGSLALTAAKSVPTPVVRGVTRVARAVLGADRVPLYDDLLPRGGRRTALLGRATGPSASSDARVVFFSACTGQMFASEAGGEGVSSAVRAVLDRAGIAYAIASDEGASGLCCGTPWKSKGHLAGYDLIAERTLVALWKSSRHGAIPIICDAASCTTGIEALLTHAIAAHPEYSTMRVEDATLFVAREALPKLTVHRRLERVVVHPTCSTTALGANSALMQIAEFVADDAYIPEEWGCCGFAGDRGMLHPELTASATESEARGVREAEAQVGVFDSYVSANRTCEIGMTRATDMPYQHVIELLDAATASEGQ